MKNITKAISTISFLLLLSTVSAQTTRNAGTYAELTTAITNSALSGDIINITNDIVVTAEISLSKSLSFNGNGYLLTVPNPGMDDMGRFNVTTSAFRLFTIAANTSVVFNNIKLKGGYLANARGGAILVAASTSTLTLQNVTISHSRAGQTIGNTGYGGGISNVGGKVFMYDSYILRNAGSYGGGIESTGGTVYMERCTVSENRGLSPSGGGGAITSINANFFINNCTISNNQGTEVGGAITNFSTTSSYFYILNSSLTGNVTYNNGTYKGGAIGNNTTTGGIYAINCVFAYNYRSTTGTVTNPGGFVLDDMEAYSGQNRVYLYYCIYHAALPVGTNNVVGNIQYTGNINGADNTIFSGGVLAKLTNNVGDEIGTETIYRPYLYSNTGNTSPTLQTGSLLSQAGNKGSATRYANNNGINPVAAYYNQTTTTWVDLTGTSNPGQLVTTDQKGATRAAVPVRGAIESETSNLYMVKVNAAANGTINGGSIYGDVYLSGSTVTLTAIPYSGYSFTGWTYVAGGTGTASTSNPYSFTVTQDVTLVPVYVASGINYSVTYVGNTNDAGTVPASTTQSVAVTLADRGTMSKAGYKFAGWNTNANGSGTAYAASANYSAGANLTLYAQWTRNYWVGTTNTDVSTTSNWEAAAMPAIDESVVFHPAANNHLYLSADAVFASVNFNGSGKNLVLGNYNLTLGLVQNAATNCYIVTNGTGKLKMNIAHNGVFNFSVGNSSYNPVTITNNSGAADDFSVRIVDEVYANGSNGTAITGNYIQRTWDISKTNANGGSGINFIFNWNNGEMIGTISTAALYHFGSGWDKQTGTTSSTATSLTYTGYTGTFSPFAIAESGFSLPLTWLGFTARKQANLVLLNWSTENEQHTEKFTVLHSIDGVEWKAIGTKPADDNSSAIHEYTFSDIEAIAGMNYYRIIQQDKDGKQTYSKVVSINMNAVAKQFSIYPNPVTNGRLNIRLESALNIKIFNSMGALVLQKNVAAGMHQLSLEMLAKGIYTIQTGNETASFVIQ